MFLFHFLERIVRKPIITESPQNVTTAVGTTNTFECKFISDLQLVIQWIYTVCQSCSNATVLQVIVYLFIYLMVYLNAFEVKTLNHFCL